MGKSRKKNINADDAQLATEILSEELKHAQLRSNPIHLKDDNLFLEDTQPDNSQIHLPVGPKRRQRASKGKRTTRAEAIINANASLPLTSGGSHPKCSKHKRPVVRNVVSRAPLVDPVVREDVWTATDTSSDWAQPRVSASRPKSMNAQNRPKIPAVEIDPAGCSYNPDHDLHQDAVAQAVAKEHLKQIDMELQPKAPPLSVTQADIDFKEMALGLYEEDSSDDDRAAGTPSGAKSVATRKTLKDRSRQTRHKLMEADHASRRSLKRLRRQLEHVPQLQAALDQQEQTSAARRARKEADTKEREMHEPPKLGRHRFQPPPLQVLASDDVTGSLRTLKTIPVIAKDRFKSLQKRGLIHVTVQQHWTKPTTKRVKRFEKKATQDMHVTTKQEILKLKQQNRGVLKKQK